MLTLIPKVIKSRESFFSLLCLRDKASISQFGRRVVIFFYGVVKCPGLTHIFVLLMELT